MKGNYLGDYLVEAGEITRAQLEKALNYQKEKRTEGQRGLLGRTLVELGCCSEEAVNMAVARQSGVEYVILEHYPIDSAARALVTPEAAARYQSLPIGFEDGRLVVAMLQPRDVITIDDLSILTGYEVKPVYVSEEEFKAALGHFVRSGSDLEQADDEEEPQEEQPAPDAATEKPAVQLANTIFSQSVRAGASDVHVEPQEKSLRVRFRIDGVLHDVMQPPRQLHASLVSRIKVMANMDIAERRVPQDGRISMKVEGRTIDIRVASLPTAYGEKLTMRLLARGSRMITLEELGFPEAGLEEYRRAIRTPYGFILVTGPTGSGKSTTLYATLSVLNDVEKHIITVEDPIEYRISGINQVQINTRAGLTFATGLRSILRNDPDIIMVGEIRDQETARIAVESALTGHLVISTLHTNDASGAIARLGDMGIEPFLVASSLIGVVAQRLARLLCSHCKAPYAIDRAGLLDRVPDFPLEEGEDSVTLYRPVGCVRCNNTGYRGRIGVYELLTVSETIQKMTLEHRSAREIRRAAIEEGMITLRRDGLAKVKKGLTSLEELIRVIA